jgi:DNA (cytosine-5)-methyltransferase 1
MNHGSLFSGIGGFDLAAQWSGWTNKFHCEWNPFGQKVLKHYWPEAESYSDITKTDFTLWRGKIDILTGGFPCQPYSQAGKRLGKEDDRHLWPEMLRAIREIQPRYVVGENVSGLVNWNGGMVFNEVQAELEAEGYEVTPFILPACAINAPHRRDRIWFVAYSKNSRCRGRKNQQCPNGEREFFQGKREGCKMGDKTQGCSGEWPTSNSGSNGHQSRGLGENRPKESESEREGNQWERIWDDIGRDVTERDVTDTYNNEGLQRRKFNGTSDEGGIQHQRKGEGQSCQTTSQLHQINDWTKFPTQSPICDGNDGISARLDGITFPKWRNESIKAGGNAIVPQVAYQIFQAIEKFETLTPILQ